MIYSFFIGKNKALSLAEIIHKLDLGGYSWSLLILTNLVAIFKLNKIIDNIIDFQDTLGGCLKIGLSSAPKKINNLSELNKSIIQLCLANDIKNLGLSLYGFSHKQTSSLISSISAIKKEISSSHKFRYLVDKKGVLSSASIINNKLIGKNSAELSILNTNNSIDIFTTLSVQNINPYSFRDIKKPYRNNKAGMLPPKLAQMMINLALNKKVDTILDPFCGTGTILIEGLIQGLNVLGSDTSPDQTSGAISNIKWLNKYFDIKRFYVINKKAESLGTKDFPLSPDAIVSELYLGPRLIPDELSNLEKLIKKQLCLYCDFLQNIKKFKIDIVLAFPVYRHKKNIIKLPLLDLFDNLGYTSKSLIQDSIYNKYPEILKGYDNKRRSLLYLLPDQKVGREIFHLSI